MRDTLKKIAVTGALLIMGGSTVPVIPAEMEILYSYRGDCVYEWDTIATTTREDPREYIPKCKNGEYAVSVFADRKGNRIHVEIPLTKYTDIGKKDGFSRNPKKSEYLSLFESLKTPAEAAIAYDTTSDPEQVAGVSSITYSHTTTGTDVGIVVATNMNDAADNCRTATYNGGSLVYVDEVARASGPRTLRLSAFYNTVATTGTYNVVVTCTGAISAGLDSHASSFTGVDQTTMLNTNKKYTSVSVSTSTISTSATTTVDGTWSVSALHNDNGPMTTGTNCTVRTTDGSSICDSNASVGAAGQYKTEVSTSFAGVMEMVTLFIAPAAGGGGGGTITPLQSIIMFE